MEKIIFSPCEAFYLLQHAKQKSIEVVWIMYYSSCPWAKTQINKQKQTHSSLFCFTSSNIQLHTIEWATAIPERHLTHLLVSVVILLHMLLWRFCTKVWLPKSHSTGYQSAAACWWRLALTFTSSNEIQLGSVLHRSKHSTESSGATRN